MDMTKNIVNNTKIFQCMNPRINIYDNSDLQYPVFQMEKTQRKKETPVNENLSAAEQVLKFVTAERIAELKTKVQKLHANCTQLHVELNEVNSGKYNSHIEVAWDEVQKRKHSLEFQSLSLLVANILAERRAKEEPKASSTKIKEEVLDEGHSSSTSNKSDKAQSKLSSAEARPGTVQLSTSLTSGAHPTTSIHISPGHTPTSVPSRSPVASSPSRGPRLVPSPRLPSGSRMVGTKTKHSDSDKTKMKAMKPQKKKPVVPKIKIKALQMASNLDPKCVAKGDKKESKITDVFHFDYQPPSGSGINPNAQYSSLYQDSKLAAGFGLEKQDPRSESFDASSSPASSATASHSQTMSPRIDPEALDLESPSFRAWKKNILLLWKTAAQNKYAHIFMHPVTDDLAPGYSSTVRRPIDLTTIKRKIDTNEIRTTAQFHRDLLLMFHNALMYNNASHSVYAYTVAMMTDVTEIIKAFYSSHNHAPDKHLQKVAIRSRAPSVASQ